MNEKTEKTDAIKEAFQRAKQDITELKSQIQALAKEIESLKFLIRPSDRQTNRPTDTPTHQQTTQQNPIIQQTEEEIIPTDNLNELHKDHLKPLKSPNLEFSTGNEGVPTDRQTDQQTDRQTTDTQIYEEKPKEEEFQEVSKLLESLDSFKEDIRQKFRKLTNQEIAVFSAIYKLEEQGFSVDYSLLAQKLKLSESSMRDYVLRMTRKGIPIQKIKENNKKILLSISPDLKKLASLSTILELRDVNRSFKH